MNSKNIPILIVILIIIIAVGYYGFSNKAPVTGTNGGTATTTTTNGDVVYSNTQYGFSFTLPSDWTGYTVVTDVWKGASTSPASTGQAVVEQGPEILLRSPQWTTATPTQDIPVMVFTLAQWDKLTHDQFHIGAAPIGPSELGRNATYVFALPARYNFAFLPGFEEVQTIITNNTPLKTF